MKVVEEFAHFSLPSLESPNLHSLVIQQKRRILNGVVQLPHPILDYTYDPVLLCSYPLQTLKPPNYLSMVL
jgi:hypothetical protein